MKKFKDGFSIQNGLVALSVVILLTASLPIMVEKISEKNINNKINDNDSSAIFQELQQSYFHSYLYSNAAIASGANVNSMSKEPIVLDLNGDGKIVISNILNGIYFDYDNNGFAEKTAWTQDGDGILAIDLNKNGKIDSEKELIHHEDFQKYDTNRDGVLNSNDKDFYLFRIIKRDGSISTFEEEGIVSVNLDIKSANFTDDFGNHKFGEGTFTKTDGKVYKFDEYYFSVDFADTKELNILKETKSVYKLPDIKCRGTVYSLHQAMIRDSELQKLVVAFTKEIKEKKRQDIIKQIILKWTKAELVDVNSRGENINAQHLAVVEAFLGQKYGQNSNNSISNIENPNVPAGELLETIYLKLENYVYAELMAQSHLKYLVKLIKHNQFGYDFSAVNSRLDKEIKNNPILGKQKVLDFARLVKGLGLDKNSNFFDPKNNECFYLKFTNNDRRLKWKIDSITKVHLVNAQIINGELKGTAGDDTYIAKDGYNSGLTIHTFMGSDVLFGNSGDDIFAACDDDDILDGGDGNDSLTGNAGNDIIFGGNGNDFIVGAEGNDIIFGGNGDDTIYPDHFDESDIVFDKLFSNRLNDIYSFNENDINYDKYYSSFHKDSCYNDIISGGKGNDTIYSMIGDDTYIFYPGDGQDTIYEKQGTDTIYFGNGIKWNDLTFVKSNDDMIIKIKKSNDKITVKNWFAAPASTNAMENINNQIEIFEFSDGSKHYSNEINI